MAKMAIILNSNHPGETVWRVRLADVPEGVTADQVADVAGKALGDSLQVVAVTVAVEDMSLDFGSALDRFMGEVASELEAVQRAGLVVSARALRDVRSRVAMAEYVDMSVRECADLLRELPAGDVLATGFLAYWGSSFNGPALRRVGLDFFSEERGYSFEDREAVAGLPAGELWRSADHGDHWVRALPMNAGLLHGDTGGGGTALMLSLDYHPEALVMVTTPDGGSAPSNPETDELLIGVYNAESTTGVSVVVRGREGLNDWYASNVGYRPDQDAGAPLPIMDLLSSVAEMAYLHRFGDGSQ